MNPSRFPDPRRAPRDAPLAWGGRADLPTLLDAYRQGIFPWPTEDGTLFWWSPDPRAVIPLDGLHVSRSLRRTLRTSGWRCTRDQAFGAVVAACADRPGEGTWITEELVAGYAALHAAGVAHSVEVWDGDVLVGGVYGIGLGGAFTGESMFSRASDGSKVALVHLVAHLRERGFVLLDAQVLTPHLRSLGALAWPRRHFLDTLAQAVTLPVTF